MVMVAHKRGGGNGVILKRSFYFLLESGSIRLDCDSMPEVIRIAITKNI